MRYRPLGRTGIDVSEIGAGGGSLAKVDAAGRLTVGPASAGAAPGPVCYARGGTHPTVTDAALVLGLIDPSFFLGGRMHLDRDAAAAAISRDIAGPLGRTTEDAAAAIMELATEHMVQAILDITVNQGIDPTDATLLSS